jgi:hypothetical protein
MDQKREQAQEWSIYKAAQELLDAWNERTIRNGMKQGGRSITTKASFATEPLYNGEAANGEEVERDLKSRESRKRKPSQDKRENEGNKRKPCWICDEPHNPKSCFLALEIQPKRVTIPEENKEVFEKRMKDSAFAKRIQSIREYLKRKDDLFTP